VNGRCAGKQCESIKNILNKVEVMTTTGGPKVQQILDDVRTTTTQVKQLMPAEQPGQRKREGEIRQIVDK
jgi:hypothetical protein